jgi:methanogenic corrinoid protein MtbC1
MWERRYGFPKPARNDSQVRVYTDADVERLILVSRALKAGFRAGEVIHRDTEELKALLASSAKAELGSLQESPTIAGLLTALRADDVTGVRSGLRQAVATLGPRQFLIDVAGPLVEQVGEAWASGQLHVRHEHLISEALSTQLRLLLSAYETDSSSPTVLLATLSHEQHGLGLEMAALYLALQGASPRLLGVDTPPDQIVEAAVALRARVVGVSVSPASDPDATVEHIRWILAELPPEIDVWLGGRAVRDLTISHPRLREIVSWNDVDRELSLLRVRGPAAAVS